MLYFLDLLLFMFIGYFTSNSVYAWPNADIEVSAQEIERDLIRFEEQAELQDYILVWQM